MLRATRSVYKDAKTVKNMFSGSTFRYSSGNSKILSTLKEYKEGAMNYHLHSILDDVLEMKMFKEIPGLSERMRNVLDYTTAGSKKIRATVIVSTYDMLESPEYKSEEAVKLAHVLGVVAEMMACHILILDDIEDGSEFRHNKPCWYKLPEIGMTAVTDAFLIKQLSLFITKKYFQNHPHFSEILDLLQMSYFTTAVGQYLDSKTSQMSANEFTMERYLLIAHNKTAYSTFYSLLLGLALTRRKNAGDYNEKIKLICNNITCIYQRQNDYHDIYDIKFNRKEGTDIQDNKCSWLAVAALQLCSPAQRLIFTNNYGSSDPDRVKCVKKLYDDLKMPEVFNAAQRELYEETEKHINSLPDERMRVYLRDFLNLMNKDIYSMF